MEMGVYMTRLDLGLSQKLKKYFDNKNVSTYKKVVRVSKTGGIYLEYLNTKVFVDDLSLVREFYIREVFCSNVKDLTNIEFCF